MINLAPNFEKQMTGHQGACSPTGLRSRAFQLLLPLMLLQSYLAATILVFFLGPWPWPIENAGLLTAYLAVAQASLATGYMFGIGRLVVKPASEISCAHSLVISKAFIVATFIAAWIGIVNSSSEVRAGGSISSAMFDAVTDLDQTYRHKGENLRSPGEGVAQRYALPFGVMAAIALPLGIAKWNSLNLWWRVLFVASRIAEIMAWASSGTTKGVADTIGVGGLFALCIHTSTLQKAKIIQIIAVIGISASLVFFYFAQSKVGEDHHGLIVDASLPIVANIDHPALQILPENLAVAGCLLANYVSQGYYALARSLEFPFEWCYFLGHGPMTSDIATRLGHPEIAERTYPARLEALGWSKTVRWHTVYVWVASDLSHFGVPVFMFIVGVLLGKTWRAAILKRCALSSVLAYFLMQMLIYAPANNQVLGFEVSASAFWIVIMGLYARRALRFA